MASQVPPKKGAAFNLGFSLYDKGGTLIVAPVSLNAQISRDFGAYGTVADSSVVSTVYGLIKLALASSDMSADVISLYATDTGNSSCVPFTATIYTAGSLIDELSTAIYGESTKLSTAIYGESTKLSTLLAALSTTVQAESTRLSTAIYGESTKLSTSIAAIVLSSATVDSTAIAASVWGNAAASTVIAGAVWNAARSSYTSTGTFGDIDQTTAVAGAVWDVVLSSHVSTGTAGAALSAASSATASADSTAIANAVWAGVVPSTFSTGTAGYAVGTFLNAAVSAVSSQVSSVATALAAVSTQVAAVSSAASSLAARVASTAVAGAVWNATRTDYVSTGTFGEVEGSTDVARQVWASAIPSTFGLGTAGYTLGTYLDASVAGVSTTVRAESTRLSTAIYGESTKLSTKVDALSSQMSSVMSEVENVYTLVDQESTKLSTGIASLSADLDTVASALSSVTSTPSTAVAAAVWDMELASTYAAQSLVRGMASVLLGKVSGSSGSTTVFRDVADGKDVVTAVTDAEGNRTTVTLDLSS